MALHTVRAVGDTQPTEVPQPSIEQDLCLRSFAAAHIEPNQQIIVCIEQALCLCQDVRRRRRKSNLTQNVRSRLRLRQRLRRRRKRPKTFRESIESTICLHGWAEESSCLIKGVAELDDLAQALADDAPFGGQYRRKNRWLTWFDNYFS